ncbi:hypothetical protein GCM10011391_33240 [Pullulanibacillus camelliae]|uniref:Uncharacterized protein n=1 Tax=Pullulanibacillus camelliae TaxID=1707096 RepID=A0A8J3DZN9_9BACL|nr:hypothetical protein GCM10011391_33240 [Pullulanibacillus camelliae]
MNVDNIQMLTPILEKGGHFLGAFGKDKLVGVAILGGEIYRIRCKVIYRRE